MRVLTLAAEQDRADIVDTIAQDNPLAATRVWSYQANVELLSR